MSIISGDPDKRAVFDSAMEAVAADVANKVGEMENFMQLSSKFMESIDLQNGIFEEEGMKMLEEWEQKSTSLLLGTDKSAILDQAHNAEDVLDINEPLKTPVRDAGHKNQYDNFFDYISFFRIVQAQLNSVDYVSKNVRFVVVYFDRYACGSAVVQYCRGCSTGHRLGTYITAARI